MYIDVAPAIPLPPHKDIFTYHAKESLLPGTFVQIPIGPRRVQGIVIRSSKKKPPYRTKEIAQVYTAALTQEQLALGGLIAGLTLGGLGFTLRMFNPPSLTLAAPVTSRRHTSKKAGGTQLVVSPLTKRVDILHQQVQAALADNQQALIVVPERWMTERFPWAQAFHAGLSASEKKKVWEQVASGTSVAIVGTQKALFLPWRRLARIVIDEEQLSTHKIWDGYPRADNRRLVSLAAQVYKSSLTLSGAFPSLAVHQARETVPALAYNIIQPAFQTIPFSFADRQGRRLLPEEAVTQLRTLKQQKKKILIIHNEKDSRALKALRALRLIKKNQILAGTSALFAQVHDESFDQVVWMFPERALTYPDIRSAERAYSMLARLHSLGKKRRTPVLLVTRRPETLDAAFSDTVAQAYARLLKERKAYLYPPFSDMVRLTFRNTSKAAARQRAIQARQAIAKKLVQERDTTRILGPYQGFEERSTKKAYETHILLLGTLETLAPAYRSTLPNIVDIDPNTIL